MEEDSDVGLADQLADELTEDDRALLAPFVEEDTKTFGDRKCLASLALTISGKTKSALLFDFDIVRKWLAILPFGTPLLLFTEAPENE